LALLYLNLINIFQLLEFYGSGRRTDLRRSLAQRTNDDDHLGASAVRVCVAIFVVGQSVLISREDERATVINGKADRSRPLALCLHY
jgi:hypothetical protein